MTNMTKTEKKLDERFKFGPAPIQTAEDATMAYLREEITKEEYREACGKFGVLPGTIMQTPGPARPDRVDAAFHRNIPDDIFLETLPEALDVDARIKEVNAKQELRDRSREEAEKLQKEQNTVVMQPAVSPHLSEERVHELEEEILVPNKVAVQVSEAAQKDKDKK